jgi:hypothetical protein
MKKKSGKYPIHTSLKKYLGTNLTKRGQTFTMNNYKTLKKEFEEDIRRCSWIGRISIMKMTIVPKTIYRFNAIPTKSCHSSQKQKN